MTRYAFPSACNTKEDMELTKLTMAQMEADIAADKAKEDQMKKVADTKADVAAMPNKMGEQAGVKLEQLKMSGDEKGDVKLEQNERKGVSIFPAQLEEKKHNALLTVEQMSKKEAKMALSDQATTGSEAEAEKEGASIPRTYSELLDSGKAAQEGEERTKAKAKAVMERVKARSTPKSGVAMFREATEKADAEKEASTSTGGQWGEPKGFAKDSEDDDDDDDYDSDEYDADVQYGQATGCGWL